VSDYTVVFRTPLRRRSATFAGALWDEPGTSAMSEDCLYLNIWTPTSSPNEKRAVLVYFHGGGGTSGEGSEAIFDGSMMAKKGV
jgi:carboxylesterase type B